MPRIHLQFLLAYQLRHKKGFHCASFDWSYDNKAMDFLGSAGWLLLGVVLLYNDYRCRFWFQNRQCSKKHLKGSSSPWPRLCLHTILQQELNAVNLMAPICSSWGLPARYTSMRNYFNWQGMDQYNFVSSANEMVSRLLKSIMY